MIAYWEEIVDARLIAAPPSPKNRTRTRDLEMKQTKKGSQWYFGQWYFGMKAHIGVDATSGRLWPPRDASIALT